MGSAKEVEDFQKILLKVEEEAKSGFAENARRPVSKAKGYFNHDQATELLKVIPKEEIRLAILRILSKKMFSINCVEANTLINQIHSRRGKVDAVDMLAPIIEDPINHQVMFDSIPFDEEREHLARVMDKMSLTERKGSAPKKERSWASHESGTHKSAKKANAESNLLLVEDLDDCAPSSVGSQLPGGHPSLFSELNNKKKPTVSNEEPMFLPGQL